MKNSILTLLLISSFNIFADCTLGETTIGINISNETLEAAYSNGSADLTNSDHAFSVINGEKTVYDIGQIEDDSAGNFTIKLISSETATYMEINHDHETWHQGLDGYFTTSDNKVIELNDFKNCDYNSLFN